SCRDGAGLARHAARLAREQADADPDSPRRVRHHPRLAGGPDLRVRPRAALVRARARRLPGGQGLLDRRRPHHHPAGAVGVAVVRVPRRARPVRHVVRRRRALQARDRRPLGDLRRQRLHSREAEGRAGRPERPRVQLRAARAPRPRLVVGGRPHPAERGRRLPAAAEPGALRHLRHRLAGLRHRPAALLALLRSQLPRRQALGRRGAPRLPSSRSPRGFLLCGGIRGGPDLASLRRALGLVGLVGCSFSPAMLASADGSAATPDGLAATPDAQLPDAPAADAPTVDAAPNPCPGPLGLLRLNIPANGSLGGDSRYTPTCSAAGATGGEDFYFLGTTGMPDTDLVLDLIESPNLDSILDVTSACEGGAGGVGRCSSVGAPGAGEGVVLPFALTPTASIPLPT